MCWDIDLCVIGTQLGSLFHTVRICLGFRIAAARMYLSDELFQCSREGYFCVYLNKHKNNTRVSTETVPQESTSIISFFTGQNESINDN